MKTGLIVTIVLVTVAGIGGTITYLNRAPATSDDLVHEVDRTRYPVRTIKVTPGTVSEKLERTGVLQGNTDVVLTAEVAGRIVKINKALGDECKKGETLLQLDREGYRIGLAQARAAVKQAEVAVDQAGRTMSRTEALKAQDVATEQQLDSAEGGLQGAQAALELAKAAQQAAARSLKETTIKCPFAGRLAERNVDLGQTVGPSVPLARLVNVDQLKLVMNVTASQLTRLKVGQRVFLSDPESTTRIPAEVSRLGVAADRMTRTFPVEIVTSNSEGLLRPGQIVRAVCELATHENVLVVPMEVVHTRDDASSVMVASGDAAKEVPVQLGPRIDDDVIVTTGLTPGAEVIVVGYDEVEDGSLIEVTNSGKTAEHVDGAQ